MVDVIKDIEKTIEEGMEEIEEVVEKAEEVVEEAVEKVEEEIGIKKTPELKDDELVEEAKKESVEMTLEEAKDKALSSSNSEEIERKKKLILEKVAKLKGKLAEPTTEELKEQVKGKKKSEPLVEIDDYVKSGIYLGTKVVTPDMKPFVYRRRADGLAIFDTNIIDDKLKEAVEFLEKFDAKDIVIVCKRPSGWKAVNKFSELTGIRTFTKKYPAGILTNTDLPDFFENELTIICDSWLDKNALADTNIVNKKVLMICDTNNFSKGTDQVIIGNNKSGKSLGMIFYLLTREYCKAKKIECDIPEMEWWTAEEGK